MYLKYFSGKPLVFGFSFLFLLSTLFLGNIPFFWDMSYIAKVAVHIYECNFTAVIFPEFNNGFPPLFSMYFAALWKLFGKSLLVSHLAILPFVFIIFVQFYKLLKRYVAPGLQFPAFLVLLAEPAFLTQFLLTGYDIVICALVLLSINSILENKRYLNVLAVVLLPVVSTRGFAFVAALYFFELYVTQKKPYKIATILRLSVPYLASLFVFGLWKPYHYHYTGWFFVSEENKYIYSGSTLNWIIRNLTYIFWKIMDSGRIFLYACIAILFFRQVKKPKSPRIKETLAICVLLFSSYVVFFVSLHSMVAQRHFISIYVLSIILFFQLLTGLQKKTRNTLIFLVNALFFAGNFWMYPVRFGNAWDASLKVIPYFKTENEFRDYTVSRKINPAEVGAQFPMNANRKYTYLEPESFEFCDIDTKPAGKFRYIVHSNICNAFKPEQIEMLSKKWILLKQFQSGQVYIRLYENPDFKESHL